MKLQARYLLAISIMTVFFFCCQSCASHLGKRTSVIRETHKTDRNLVNEVNNPGTVTFLDMLRGEPGLDIRGSGDNVNIFVRGANSLLGDNNPLYVVDGLAVGRTFKDASSQIDVHRVISVRVLKPAQAGIWGSRGSNGIILVKTQ